MTPPTFDSPFSPDGSCDSAAFEDFARRVTPELERLARRMGASREQSRDAAQDTWLAVLEARGHFDARRPLKPWLHAILRFRWRSTLRREGRRSAVADSHAAAQLAERDDARRAELADALERVRCALRDLPERYREPLVLHLVEGLSPIEVAQRLGQSRSSVRVLLHRGRERLKRALPRQAFAMLLSLRRRGTAHATPRWRLLASAALLSVAASVLAVLAVSDATRKSLTSRAHAELAYIEREASSPAAELETRAAPLAERIEVRADTRLAIHVRDSRGAPLAGVGLTVEPLDGSDPRVHRREAVTDAGGFASVERTPNVPQRVALDRGGALEVAPDALECTLTAPAGVRVLGRVVDELGKPLADAGVWLGDVAGSRCGQVVAQTRADGTFELREVPADASLAAVAPGHQRTPMIPLPGAGPEQQVALELVARRGAALVSVTVLDADGSPLEDARVLVGRSVDGVPQQLAGGRLPAFPPPFDGRTDERGHVECTSLEPGRHSIVVRASGRVPWATTIELADRGERALEARLQLGFQVRGRVVSAVGEPLARAQVACNHGDPLVDTALACADDGSFVLDSLPAGNLWIAARAFDHGSAERELTVGASNEVIELALAPLPMCEGTLRDDGGAPLGNFEIRLLGSPSRSIAPNSDEGLTGNDGTFALAVPGGDIRRIEVRAPSWPVWCVVQRAWLRIDGERLLIEMPLAAQPQSWLRGTFVDAHGTPLRERSVDLVRHIDARTLDWMPDVARSDAQGALSIGPLPAGKYELVLAARGRDERGALAGSLGCWTLAAGAELDVGRSLPAASTLECRLRFRDGTTPLAPVVAWSLPGVPGELATWFECERTLELLPGRYAFKALGDDFAWVDADALQLHAGARELWEPRLERASAMRIALAELPHDVERAAGVVVARQGDDAPLGTFALESGLERRQVLECFLAPGNYRALVRRAGGALAQVPFEVSQASPDMLELSFER
ncbi:MAG: sigma-70 family RNA polymerase sigma factor [Planctomycetes bacterium]|nr:sigma-70 family RNA polymerase sigma factor [Planctomycetota bacterium]